MIRKIGMWAWMLVCLTGCMRQTRLEAVLDLADENRQELEAVLEHYRNDERKYRAACFLIENMAHRHSVTGKGVDEFYSFIDSVYRIQQQGGYTKRTGNCSGPVYYKKWVSCKSGGTEECSPSDC